MGIDYEWRGRFTNEEANALHAEAFETRVFDASEWNWVDLTQRHSLRTAGCEWLHVDFDDDLRPFYFDACGFRPTNGGLIHL
jgi:hypothetical protein